MLKLEGQKPFDEFEQIKADAVTNKMFEDQLKKYESRNPDLKFNSKILGTLGSRSHVISVQKKISPVAGRGGGQQATAIAPIASIIPKKEIPNRNCQNSPL